METSWTETTDIPTATQEHASLGTSTAGLIWGGSLIQHPHKKILQLNATYDGSSWTSYGNYPIVAKVGTSFGSQTDGIGAGGQVQKLVAANYNGTAWTTVNSLATARQGYIRKWNRYFRFCSWWLYNDRSYNNRRMDIYRFRSIINTSSWIFRRNSRTSLL